MAPRSQRRGFTDSRAGARPRRKTRRNFFTFMLVQLLIGGMAFMFVRDYMSDGFTKQAVANVLNQVQCRH